VHESAVDCSVHRGLVRGVGDGLFAPARATTRGQAASALAFALQSTGAALPADPPNAFDDDDDSTHEPAIDRLAALGLVTGVGPREYSLTRRSPAARPPRCWSAPRKSRAGATAPRRRPLPDDGGSPHELAIDKATDAGWMGAQSHQAFAPGDALSRRQLASVLIRWVDPRVR
jgi:hypothetical protein